MKRLIVFMLAIFTLQACSVQTLFDNLGAKDKESRRAARDIAFGSHDRQKLDVYVPLNSSGSDPVLMFIYGGSWNTGDKDGYDFVGRAFAAEGFVTVIADYRLVPEVRFPSFVEDGAAAVKWIDENIDEFGGNPEEIYLVGHSAGAYNAIMLAVDHRFLGAHGLGKDTIDGAAGIAGPYDFFPFDVPASVEAFKGADNPAVTTQPVAIADASAPPLLLVSGTEDKVVKLRNITAMEAVGKENDTRVESRYYEGLDHIEPVTAISVTFRNKAPVLSDIVKFFNSIETE